MKNPDIFKPASRPVYTVDYSDLEQFVSKMYETRNFEIFEVNNDSTIACDTDLKYFDVQDEEETRFYIEKGHCNGWQVPQIIKLLFKDGHIADGAYNIDVSW